MAIQNNAKLPLQHLSCGLTYSVKGVKVVTRIKNLKTVTSIFIQKLFPSHEEATSSTKVPILLGIFMLTNIFQLSLLPCLHMYQTLNFSVIGNLPKAIDSG